MLRPIPSLALIALVAGCHAIPTLRPTALIDRTGESAALGFIPDAQLLRRTPQVPNVRDQWDMACMRTQEAWELRDGADDVVVAIVDTGIDLGHPELAGRMEPGINVTRPDEPPQDDLGHGTAVAGIIAAAHDGRGIAGVAPRSRLMPIKVNVPGTGGVRAADAAAGIRWAVDHGARILNLSIGFEDGETGLTPETLQQLKQAIAHALASEALVVCASGNIGDSPKQVYPASWAGTPGFENLVAVGATDRRDRRAAFSNYGPWLSVMAPADDVPSLAIGGYGRFGGTSAAAPHVSGLAALLTTPGRPPSPRTLRQWILAGVQDVGPRGECGAGRVDALISIQASSRR